MYLKRIKDIREDRDLLQKQISSVLRISQQYYSEYELGKRAIPIEKLIVLADFYNVSLDWLCNRTNKKEVNK